MELSKKQRNYIRKYGAVNTPSQISQKLGIEVGKVEEYIKEHGIGVRNSMPSEDRTNLDFKKFLFFNRNKIILIVLLSSLVYLNTLGNAYVSDDREIVASYNRQNYIQEMLTLKATYRIPIFTHYLDSLGGLSPWKSHLTNLILHSFTSVLVFFVVRLLVRPEIAFFSALIFTAHPIHTDAVSWAVSRSYILFSVFILLSFVYYLKATEKETFGKKEFFVSLIFFLLSFDARWAEPMSFPLILVVYNLSFRSLKKYWKSLIPYFIVMAVVPLYLLNNIQGRIADTSISPSGQLNLSNPLVQIPISIYTYLKLFILPINLTFYHEDLSLNTFEYLLAIITVVLLITSIIYFYKKDKIIFFCLSLFLLSISHTLTPLRISWAVAERYVYFGSIGLTTILSYVIFKALKNKLGSSLHYALLVIILTGFSLLTIFRNFDWKNEDSLWIATAKVSPGSSKAWNNMGDYYGRHNDLQASFDAFVRATQINPEYSDAWHNAGNTLIQMTKYDEAIPYFEKSLQFNPTLIEAYNNLALVYHKKNDEIKSAQMISKSLQINESAAKTYSMWAYIEYENKNIEKAKEILREGLKFNPKNQALQQNLANLEKSQTQN